MNGMVYKFTRGMGFMYLISKIISFLMHEEGHGILIAAIY